MTDDCHRGGTILAWAVAVLLLCVNSGGIADSYEPREYHSEKHSFRLVPVGGPFVEGQR